MMNFGRHIYSMTIEIESQAYSVATEDGGIEKTERSGLSHAAAMTFAEKCQRDGKVARVMHVIGANRYEIDRYPPR
jgi:hypothetical protein